RAQRSVRDVETFAVRQGLPCVFEDAAVARSLPPVEAVVARRRFLFCSDPDEIDRVVEERPAVDGQERLRRGHCTMFESAFKTREGGTARARYSWITSPAMSWRALST